MKFNFKKVSAIATSVLMFGMTMGVAAAANYPAPFVSGGVADVAIVYGTGAGASFLDLVDAGDIQTDLQAKMGTTSGGTPGSVTGESAPIWSGSDRIYFKDQLGDGGVTQATKSDLPTILADGTFDNGIDNDYTQRIEFGAATYPTFTFSDSGSDLSDPELIMDLGTATTTPVYDLIIDFDAATTFNSTDAEGEQITLFGKEYTVSTETDGDELYLFASSETVSLSIQGTDPSSTEVTVDEKTYTVTLTGATATTAIVKVTNAAGTSNTKEVTEGSSSKINGLEVGVNIAQSSEATSSESAELMIGANKIKLKEGDEVKVGSALDGIDGTYVDLTPNADTSLLTQIKIRVTADDNENDHLSVGDSFVDPVFGSFKLLFAGIKDGPDLSLDEHDANTERSKIEVLRDSNSALKVKMTDENGKTAAIPFALDSTAASDGTDQILADKDGNVISVVEGEDVSTDESYVVLNSGGEYVAMGQIKTITNTDCTATDLTIEDVFTGEDIVNWDDQVVDTNKTFTYKGKTFTVTCADSAALSIADATTTKINVYPFVEPFSGYNHKVAMVQDVIAIDNATAASDTIIVLPTGEVTAAFADGITTYDCILTLSGTGITETIISGNDTAVNDTVLVGTVYYNFMLDETGTDDMACTAVDLTIGVEPTIISDNSDMSTQAGLLIVEEDDATNSDANEAIYIEVDDSGTTNYYLEAEAPIFTDTEVSDTFTADGLTGYFDAFGAYALRNTDGDQDIIEVTLPKTQMYAEMYAAEDTATVTAGTPGTPGSPTPLGNVKVRDSEVSSVATKNLIVIGGSCINSAAATLVGGAYCGSAWTEKTTVGSGQFLIKSYSGTTATNGLTSEVALLVAGYEFTDTGNAAIYLTTKVVDTSKGYIGTTANVAANEITAA